MTDVTGNTAATWYDPSRQGVTQVTQGVDGWAYTNQSDAIDDIVATIREILHITQPHTQLLKTPQMTA